MKITLASRIYRPEPAAASFYLGAVVDELMAAGHTVEVITARPPKNLRDHPDFTNSRETYIPINVVRDKSGYVRGYVSYMSYDLQLLWKLLRGKKPDTIFVEPPPTTGFVVKLVSKLRKIPYVYDAADVWADAARGVTRCGIVVRVVEALEKSAWRSASQLVTISNGVKQRVAQMEPRARVVVTGFGANTAEFFYHKQPIEDIFVYAGTYSELHGAEIFLDAFAMFVQKMPNFRLLFVGNGTERAALEAKTRELGLENKVEFSGPVPATDLNDLLGRSRLSLASLHPDSGYEYAFTSKIYSALAAGCPVLFAGVGPTRDFLARAEDILPVGKSCSYDAHAVCEQMLTAVTHAPDSSIREQIAAWTKEHYSLQACARSVVKELEKAVCEWRSAS